MPVTPQKKNQYQLSPSMTYVAINRPMIDSADTTLFVNVLLGIETNPTYVQRSDINGDGVANGKDIQPFVVLLL